MKMQYNFTKLNQLNCPFFVEPIQAGGKLKATTLWESPNKGATNESGFNAFPRGNRYDNGGFDYIGGYGNFWSSSETNNKDAWNRAPDYNYSEVYRTTPIGKMGCRVVA